MWLTFESGGLVLLVYRDLVVVSLEMLFVTRDATLHSVSLMEEIVDLKDDELSAPQCCSMCVLPICVHAYTVDLPKQMYMYVSASVSVPGVWLCVY